MSGTFNTDWMPHRRRERMSGMTWAKTVHECAMPNVDADTRGVGSVWRCETEGCDRFWLLERYEMAMPYTPWFREVGATTALTSSPDPVIVRGQYVDRRGAS